MARGWESKEVESQILSAEERRAERESLQEDPGKAEYDRARDSVQVSRERVVHELERARHPRHRAMLEESLRHLDQKLAGFNGTDTNP